MRLIDGDALIEKFNEKVDMAECLIDARTAERFATFCALADAVEEMPTADAEVVVRCKDCKHYKYRMCELIGNIMDGYYHGTFDVKRPDDFCSYGVKKGGDEVYADD